MADERQAGRITLGTLDYVWERLTTRLVGLSQDEYLWEPMPDMWSVRPGDDGVWRAQVQRGTDPDPAPVTTIAWRLWHIASDCLAAYTVNGLGDWPLADLPPGGEEWHERVDEAVAALEVAWRGFREGLARLGEDGMWRQLGPAWGSYADETWLALALHALDEVAHHGAEVALLRDLYARRDRHPESA